MKNRRFVSVVKGASCCVAGLLFLMWQAYGGEKGTTERSEAHIHLEAETAKRGSGQENPGLIKKLRIEVARSGDAAERKKIRTELKDEDPVRQSEAIEMAKSVGGEDMICWLAELLSDTNGYRSVEIAEMPQGSQPQGDVVLGPPSEQAAIALSHLIDNPPVPPIGADKKFYTEEDVLTWRRWWETNKANFLAVQ
ncbi:MAG: hypothetical protein ACOX3F_08655 [Kiritimatiellia bacterium]|jgi:hypothetical protein